jgi:cytochrome c
MQERLRAAGIATGLMLVASLCAAQAPSKPVPTEVPVQALVDRYRCMNCHGMVHKQVGPGFAQVAERYRNDAAAPARLADRIRNGGVGEWGRVIMPRQPGMTEAESKVLAGWVLAQPSPAR